MSKQLTFSAAIAVLSMAAFALAVSLGDITAVGGTNLAAQFPLVELTASR